MSYKALTPAQMEIVSAVTQTYGTDPEDITFFTDAADPFLGYDTSCVLLNRLVPDLADIDHELVPGFSTDTVNVKVRLTDVKGRSRSGLGVVNRSEKGADGHPLSDQQLHYTALSRGLRSACRTAGIDLMRLHYEQGRIAEFTGSDERKRLLAEVHALGQEVGYIAREGSGYDKAVWRRFLLNRYGVESSRSLSADSLADLAAALRSIRPRRAA